MRFVYSVSLRNITFKESQTEWEELCRRVTTKLAYVCVRENLREWKSDKNRELNRARRHGTGRDKPPSDEHVRVFKRERERIRSTNWQVKTMIFTHAHTQHTHGNGRHAHRHTPIHWNSRSVILGLSECQNCGASSLCQCCVRTHSPSGTLTVWTINFVRCVCVNVCVYDSGVRSRKLRRQWLDRVFHYTQRRADTMRRWMSSRKKIAFAFFLLLMAQFCFRLIIYFSFPFPHFYSFYFRIFSGEKMFRFCCRKKKNKNISILKRDIYFTRR